MKSVKDVQIPASGPLNSKYHWAQPKAVWPEARAGFQRVRPASHSAPLQLPKLFIHTQENMKAALLTSLMDSPSIWSKEELCGSSSSFHWLLDFLRQWPRGSLRAANSPITLLELENFSEFLMLGGPSCGFLRGSEAHPPSSPIIKMWKPFTLSVFQIHGNNHNATLNAYST